MTGHEYLTKQQGHTIVSVPTKNSDSDSDSDVTYECTVCKRGFWVTANSVWLMDKYHVLGFYNFSNGEEENMPSCSENVVKDVLT
jgi:hypothetical protein